MLKKFLHLTFFIALLAGGRVVAQNQESTIFDEATTIYSRSIYGGALLHTNGWGAHLTLGRNKGAFKSQIYQFDFVTMKHPKEVRSFNQTLEDTRSYIFGKLNSFFIIRPTIGVRRTVFDKIRDQGVGIGYSWRVGPSLGFTKPVYLEIGIPDGNFFERFVVEKYDPVKHSNNEIVGRAGGLRGFDELKLKPGVHGAFALFFEYDPDREGIKGIELGATVDYFPLEEVEIMAFAENYKVFVNLYLCLQFGKKFNK